MYSAAIGIVKKHILAEFKFQQKTCKRELQPTTLYNYNQFLQ